MWLEDAGIERRVAPATPGVERAAEPRSPSDALLQRVRRADFRFLLPDPRLGRVAVLGEPAQDLVEALRSLGARVRVLDARGTGPSRDADSHDLVVARGGSRELLERARGLLRPGGLVYVESRQRVGLPWRGEIASAAGLAGAARRIGLRGVATHWHWPDFARALEIVPLDDPAVLRHALSRRRSSPGARAKAWLARRLSALGAMQRLAPCVSLVARRDGVAAAEPASGVIRFLEANCERLGLHRHGIRGPLSYVLVTPRFRASRHVVFLVFERGRSDPGLVAKLPRFANASTLAREAANLRAVQERGAGFASIPRVLAFETCGDRPVLVQTALAGSALDRATVQRYPDPWCRAILDWLGELESGGERAPLEPGWFERLVEGPLDSLASLASPSSREVRAIECTRKLAATLLGRRPPPGVFEHGDLSPPNVLRLRGGGIGILDWELAEPHGLPAGDLFFFLTWVAWARERAESLEARRAALHRAFFGRDAWARPYVLAYARRIGLPLDALTPLFALTWARTLGRFVERLGGPAESFAEGSSQWLRQNRYYSVWRHSLAHRDELRWSDGRGAPGAIAP